MAIPGHVPNKTLCLPFGHIVLYGSIVVLRVVLVSRTKTNRIGFTILLLPVVSRSVSQH